MSSADPAAVPAEPRLVDRAIRGVRWTALARLAAEIVAFGGSIVLARHIAPAEFGRAAAAVGLAALGPAFLYQAFGAPLIQSAELHRRQPQTAALLSLVAGACLALAAAVAASTAVRTLLGERVEYLTLLALPAVVVAAAASVPRALLQRELAFGWLATIEIGSLLAGTATATVLAVVGGLDGEALVLGFVAGTAATAVLSVARAPWSTPRWHGRDPAMGLLRFGVPAGLSSVVYAASRSIDYLVLAGRLGPADAGYYWRAFLMGVEYQSKLSVVMLRVAFPVYSRAPSIADIRRYRLRVMATHAAGLFPLLATLLVTAPVVIPWLFGERWEPSVVPTQILTGAGAAVALITGTGPFMLAIGRPQPLLIYNLVGLVGLGVTAYAAAPLGLNGVSVAVLGFYCVLLVVNHYFLLHVVGGISSRDLWVEALPPFLACVPQVAVTYPLVQTMRDAELPALVTLLAAIPLGFAVYVGALRIAFPSTWRAVRATAARVVRPG